MRQPSVVAARFVILIIHLFLTIIVLLSQSNNVNACMRSGSFSQGRYSLLDTQITIAVSISFGLFCVEFIGILFSLSLFVFLQDIFSMLCHMTGSIVLLVYIFNVWCSGTYWFVFGFCCAAPALTEIFVWLHHCCVRRKIKQ